MEKNEKKTWGSLNMVLILSKCKIEGSDTWQELPCIFWVQSLYYNPKQLLFIAN